MKKILLDIWVVGSLQLLALSKVSEFVRRSDKEIESKVDVYRCYFKSTENIF
jgi:hypothetical protein